MEVWHNVHLIAGSASNMYLCVDEGELTLVDAGIARDQQLVLDKIAQLGYKLQDLKRIVVTHADLDHAGCAAGMVARTGAVVLAGHQTAQHLRQGKSAEHLPRPVQWFTNRFLTYKPIPATALETFADGDGLPVLGGLQALATPGHTLDHFSFYNSATGVLFAGDALNTRSDRLQRTPRWISADESAADESALRLLQLTPTVFACGHGPPLSSHDAGDLMRLSNELRAR